MIRNIYLLFYYFFAYHLPSSYSIIGGRIFNSIRIFCVKRIFRKCGAISIIDTHVYFGKGFEIEIGDGSGLGANNHIPNNIKIGDYVMMGPDIYIVGNAENHKFERTDIPMSLQGKENVGATVIENDCWIGARVIMTAGRHVKTGSIVAAGAVLTKNFEEYSIVGGNPARLIRKRR